MRKLIAFLAFAALCLIAAKLFSVICPAPQPDTFDRPYDVTVLDEHKVQLTYRTDTVYLYLENAYAFKEKTVFIKLKK